MVIFQSGYTVDSTSSIFAMSDPVTEIKNESRIIQQKIKELENRVIEFQQHHDAINKIQELEDKINRIENLLNDKLSHVYSCSDDTKKAVTTLVDEMHKKLGDEPEF